MADEQAIKGKRILVSILAIFLIFDTKIFPVLMYGAEIWDTDYQQAVERVHYYACKRYICVRLYYSNDAVLGDFF